MTKKWRFFWKKKFFPKNFFEKISRLVYKTPGRWSQIFKKNLKNFWKNLRNLKNSTKKVVNFIYLEKLPWVGFNGTQKWVPGPPNNLLKRKLAFVKPKNWDSWSKHTWAAITYILMRPGGIRKVINFPIWVGCRSWTRLFYFLGLTGRFFEKKSIYWVFRSNCRSGLKNRR